MTIPRQSSRPALPRHRHRSLTTPPAPAPAPAPAPSGAATKWAQLKKLGAPALAIYLAIGVVDLTLSFLLVSAVGADRVREAEDWVLDKLEWRRKDGEPGKIKNAITTRVEGWKESHGGGHRELPPPPPLPSTAPVPAGPAPTPTGYSAIATTAVLAYAIHKTVLLPFRVGVTVAITPRVVRVLQSWGWKVGLGAAGTMGTGAATTASKAA